MVTSLHGDLNTLRKLREGLVALPTSIAIQVAQDVAPELTRMARESYDAGQTVYGAPRPEGTRGDKLDLVDSGATRRDMRFEAIGTRVRCVLGPRWAKYLIGKYKILPVGDRSAIPAKWQATIAASVRVRLKERVAA